MKNKTPFPTENHKDHFIYDNVPFINSEHGNLQPIQWAYVIDINLMPPTDEDDDIDDYFTRPEYYLQVTAKGEVRGVTHQHDEHEDYFSVTARDSDVRFLKAFATHYPNATPTLITLMGYRKYREAKWNEELDQEREKNSDND
jgi:hypothetical protein